MQICQIIQQAKNKPLFSAELIPPKKGGSWPKIVDTVRQLQQVGIAWVSVTSHSHQRSVETMAGKSVVRIRKKRLDTNALCIGLKEQLGIEVMPHLICHGFTKDETEDALFNLHFFGVENVLALRGDSLPGTLPFQIEQLHNNFANELVEQIQQMNRGKYLEAIDNALPTNFCIGVAGYPEKHYEALAPEVDLQHLKAKVAAGAHFIIAQMCFDNSAFFKFVEAVRALGITLPIIAGIKPVFKMAHITSLPKIFHISVPNKLRQALTKFSRPEDIRQTGIEYTIQQCQELLKYGVPYLHFYTMSEADPTTEIIRNLN